MGKRINLEQGTSEWLEWRKKGIGGSDIPVIFGVSEYRTPHELWLEKTGQLKDEKKDNYIFDVGHAKEKVARSKFEIDYNYEFSPALFMHPEYEFMRVSLDGHNEEIGAVWECKYVGKKDFEMIGKKQCPEKFNLQIQYQLFVSNSDLCFLTGINKDDEIKTLAVTRDPKKITEIQSRVLTFWNLIQEKTSPGLSDRDCVEVKDQLLKKLLSQYALLEKDKKLIEQKQKEIKPQIEKLMVHSNMRTENCHAQIITRKGNVDYSKIPELKNVNLEGYRKKDTKYLQVKVKNETKKSVD